MPDPGTSPEPTPEPTDPPLEEPGGDSTDDGDDVLGVRVTDQAARPAAVLPFAGRVAVLPFTGRDLTLLLVAGSLLFGSGIAIVRFGKPRFTRSVSERVRR